jgi:hypothetical protein
MQIAEEFIVDETQIKVGSELLARGGDRTRTQENFVSTIYSKKETC